MPYKPAIDIGLPQTLADGASLPSAVEIGVVRYIYNGQTIELRRGPVDGQALALATRTGAGDVDSVDLTNHYARGVVITLDVTSISTTLTLRIQYKDVPSGQYEYINAAPTGVSSTGTYTYVLYPDTDTAEGDINNKWNMALPRTWRVRVNHGGASAATYSVGYSYMV